MVVKCVSQRQVVRVSQCSLVTAGEVQPDGKALAKACGTGQACLAVKQSLSVPRAWCAGRKHDTMRLPGLCHVKEYKKTN